MTTGGPPPNLALCRSADVLGGVWYVTAQCPAFPLHVERDELEMNLVVTGNLRARAGNEEFELGPGDLLWLAPGHLHGLLRVSPDASVWVVSFRWALVESLRPLDRTLGSCRAGERVCLDRELLRSLSRRCFVLLGLQRTPALFNRALSDFLLRAWRVPSVSRSNTPDVHPAVERARCWLSGAPERWSLPSLSKRAGLSAFQLSRRFHEQTGVTLAHYANHQRVQRFARLKARYPDFTALETAFEAGFGSYAQFFRVFRAVTGWTPSQHDTLLASERLPRLMFR